MHLQRGGRSCRSPSYTKGLNKKAIWSWKYDDKNGWNPIWCSSRGTYWHNLRSSPPTNLQPAEIFFQTFHFFHFQLLLQTCIFGEAEFGSNTLWEVKFQFLISPACLHFTHLKSQIPNSASSAEVFLPSQHVLSYATPTNFGLSYDPNTMGCHLSKIWLKSCVHCNHLSGEGRS